MRYVSYRQRLTGHEGHHGVRRSMRYVFYRQLLKGGVKDTKVSNARGRAAFGRSRSLRVFAFRRLSSDA